MKYRVSSMKFRKKNYHSSARLHGFIRDTRYAIRDERGFTLVELIVSIGLFSIVMLVSVGALLALTGANRKAQALQSVMNNLNIALDGMVRSIRMGSDYHCGTGVFIGTGNLDDCSTSGGTRFVFKPFDGDPNQWVYLYDTDGTYCGTKRICKSVNEDDIQHSGNSRPAATGFIVFSIVYTVCSIKKTKYRIQDTEYEIRYERLPSWKLWSRYRS